jgi:hypothetical protein
VVGYSNRRHAAAGGFLGEFANITGAVQQGIIRMEMQVYKICGRHENLF